MRIAAILIAIAMSAVLSVAIAYMVVAQQACQMCLAGWAEDIRAIPLEPPQCPSREEDARVISVFIGE